MRIAINTETRRIVTWANEAVPSLAMTRRDRFPVEVKFIAGAAYVALPEGAAGRLLLKRPGNFAGAPVAADLDWIASGEGRSAVYTFFLDLDTLEMNTLFEGEPASAEVVLEIEWTYTAGDLPEVRMSSLPVPVALSNDYIREEDGTPGAAIDLRATLAEAVTGADNDKWMTPLRTRQAIEAWAGGARPADSKYGPHASVEDALVAVPVGSRYQGLTVGVLSGGSVVEYWFPGGIGDEDLELKLVLDSGTF